MVETRHDDLVTLAQLTRDAAGEVERERGHVLAKDDLLGPGSAQEVGYGRPRGDDRGVRGLARPEGAAVVRVHQHEVVAHPVERLAADLRAPGVVKEDRARIERGKVGPDGGRIDHEGLLARTLRRARA
jgi:hypothetical protein